MSNTILALLIFLIILIAIVLALQGLVLGVVFRVFRSITGEEWDN